ncbi:hypothetical protein [Plantactinospora soyae]|uniref:Uncharacterized protein n=1 Tax=Plantactinospora soyae TaxID=1544732 RepID=A0A927M2E8_9ACTN|nr:hypothetical protein [Plantactinospora soyae]MBE1485607.1 hypothetical protein [Plantactinospora soyae]
MLLALPGIVIQPCSTTSYSIDYSDKLASHLTKTAEPGVIDQPYIASFVALYFTDFYGDWRLPSGESAQYSDISALWKLISGGTLKEIPNSHRDLPDCGEGG